MIEIKKNRYCKCQKISKLDDILLKSRHEYVTSYNRTVLMISL